MKNPAQPTNSASPTMSKSQWLLLLLLSVLWGGSFFFIEIALTDIDTLPLVTLRVLIAALALWLYVAYKRLPMSYPPTIWVAFLAMGLLNNVLPFILIVWGQTQISAGLAAILNATTPLFTVIAAHFLLADEKASLQKIVGVGLGFIGVIFIIGPSLISELGLDLAAQGAVLAAAISYAFAGIYGRRFKALKINPVVTAAGQVTASSLILLPISLIFFDMNLTGVSFKSWSAILGLSLLSTAVAYILYFKLLASSGATNLLLVTFLIPVSAIALGMVFLDETLSLEQLIGMVIIGLGLIVMDGRLIKKLNRP
jgi:drug/metabolite transporter (DMT)-like permease